MDYKLNQENSQVLVFGSSGFIGSDIVIALKESGYSVLGIDIHGADINADLSDFNLSELIPYIDKNKNIGIVNCAGYNQKVETSNKISTNSSWFQAERWQRCIDLNLTLPFRLAKFAEECLMKTSNLVDVIYLGSLYASKSPNNSLYRGVEGMSFKEVEYVASKHGLVGMVKGLNALNLDERLRFNVISPGAVFHENMSIQFQENFSRISGGEMNNVNEISRLVLQVLFQSWGLFRGGDIQAHGGAFN